MLALAQTDQAVPILTRHANRRGGQRRVTVAQIAAVLDLGRVCHGRSAVCYFFGRAEARWARERLGGRAADHLQGIVVVTSLTGEILTVYRNRSGARHLRRKRR